MTLERMTVLMDRISQLAHDQFNAGISAGHPLASLSERDTSAARQDELRGIAEDLSRLLADTYAQGQYDAGLGAEDMF